MITIWNKTSTVIASKSVTIQPNQIVVLPIFPEDLTQALASGYIEVSSYEQSTRMYDFTPANCQAITFNASAALSAAINVREILICATEACWISIGSAPVAAVGAAGSIPLLKGEKMHLQIQPGYKISVIQDTTTGKLIINPTILS